MSSSSVSIESTGSPVVPTAAVVAEDAAAVDGGVARVLVGVVVDDGAAPPAGASLPALRRAHPEVRARGQQRDGDRDHRRVPSAPGTLSTS
ncbi:MAG: hypothetical protein R2726_22180 [Acidimicrobiales bacterium]